MMTESFNWTHSGLDWGQFHSLVNLLSLRNGGQIEARSIADQVLDEDWDSDEDGDTASVNTVSPQLISASGHERLRKRFLDCLAGFAANKKGGRAVACSAMRETEDTVAVYIARNEGFRDPDGTAFTQVAQLLTQISSESDDQSESLLWDTMLLYHQSRIEQDYIPSLRASFKEDDARNQSLTRQDDATLPSALSSLRGLLFDYHGSSSNYLDRHKKLLITSYEIRRNRDIENWLYSSPNATSKSKRLWLDICMVSRLRVAFLYFKEIAVTLPSFEHVTIVLVPAPHSSGQLKKRPQAAPLPLKETFGVLGLDFESTTVKAIFGPKYTVPRLQREFATRQNQKANVHAEVQMSMHLSTNGAFASDLFPYFGCSKLCCFMCDRFLRSYARFQTRGCHGRLYEKWTVPNADGLLSGRADRIAKALILVQNEVANELRAPVRQLGIPLERTSVVGGSSIFTDWRDEFSEQKLHMERLKMKFEQERVVEGFRRQLAEREILAQTGRLIDAHSPESAGRCGICRRKTYRRCSVCNQDFFCSDACEEKRSGRHLFRCSKRPLTSADYLWESAAEDLMPKEESVLEDFGFTQLISGSDRASLFGLYRRMYTFNVAAEDMHTWRVEGVLADRIKEFYNTLPEYAKFPYLAWFLEHQDMLDLSRPVSRDEVEDSLTVESLEAKARLFLDIADRNTPREELRPRAKADSFRLLALLLMDACPHPMLSIYYTFGFCTCSTPDQESILRQLYILLLVPSDGSAFYQYHDSRRGGHIPPASFSDFWRALESGTLHTLIAAKNLRYLRRQLPFIQGFLSTPPNSGRPSVWDLKQFLEINDPYKFSPIRPVQADYGFLNCESFEDTCVLMEIYRTVLKRASPAELHNACVKGELEGFVERYVPLEAKWRRLLWNGYPLDDERGELVGVARELERDADADVEVKLEDLLFKPRKEEDGEEDKEWM